MRIKRIKNTVIALLFVSVCAFGVSVYAANEQYDKKSYVTFTSVVLPDKCDNVTFAQTKNDKNGKNKGKTTNRSYGQIKMSSYKNCSKVDCWLRTYVNQTWHYWTPYILSNVSDKSKHKIKYCNQKSSYYKSGVEAQLRGENADSRIAIFSDSKVSGEVWFN